MQNALYSNTHNGPSLTIVDSDDRTGIFAGTLHHQGINYDIVNGRYASLNGYQPPTVVTLIAAHQDHGYFALTLFSPSRGTHELTGHCVHVTYDGAVSSLPGDFVRNA
ncbi:hypothetical protein [Pseudomonas sp. H1h]|uniref:hypothetical protein n=1 Tax=Pseudomonas sp. H1h TaxID=1397280 RepID=UPI000469565C|nr:hypothetical protein [Pseudomonas sp. H1h]